jgi:hypothetical protein
MKKLMAVGLTLLLTVICIIPHPLAKEPNIAKIIYMEDDEPSLNVTLKVWELFPRLDLRWYLIGVSVKNLDNRWLTLGVGRPAGGFVIYNESGTEIYRKPEYTIQVLNGLSLGPHQRKTLYLGIWNMRWQIAEKYVVYGVMYSYEYKGETYPSIKSDPVTIYPPMEVLLTYR